MKKFFAWVTLGVVGIGVCDFLVTLIKYLRMKRS